MSHGALRQCGIILAMIVRPALLSQEAIEKIRLQTLAVIEPLQQAENESAFWKEGTGQMQDVPFRTTTSSISC